MFGLSETAGFCCFNIWEFDADKDFHAYRRRWDKDLKRSIPFSYNYDKVRNEGLNPLNWFLDRNTAFYIDYTDNGSP